MQNQTVHPIRRAYQSAKRALWVPPEEAHDFIRSKGFSRLIADELCEWMSRRFSMSFLAGYLGHKAPVSQLQDVTRQLMKMKYSPVRAEELAKLIHDNLPGLYKKGQSLQHVKNW